MSASVSWAKLGIIAGAGDLPVRLAEYCRAERRTYFVSRISGITGDELENHPGADVPLDKMGLRFDGLRAAGCDAVVLAGQVRRPDFATFAPDELTVEMLPRILAAAGQGDDALLRALIAECERAGFTVIGAHDVLAALLAAPGAMGMHAPDERALKDIAAGAKIVGALGALDVGQAAVMCAGLALAGEAQEGTDLMLARVAELPAHLRGSSEKRRGVLVKQTKPTQERRIDLPTIGVGTVERAATAGLAGIAVESGGTLIVDRPAVIERADALGLFVYGFGPSEP
jgi:DUF1009 family protein